jgi:F-box protein 9
MEQTEAELERFRQQWKEEVSARNRRGYRPEAGEPSSTGSSINPTHKREPRTRHSRNISEDFLEPRIYHDIDEKEHGHKLGDSSNPSVSLVKQEPTTALEHYERAVEREGQGNLGGAVQHYRRAFKLDAQVQDKYKTKHFPLAKQLVPTQLDTAAAPVPPPQSVSDLIAEFSQLSILGAPPPTELSPAPPCPISQIPDEILVDILQHIALSNPAAYSRVSQVCKRLAYLVAVEESIWRKLCLDSEYGFRGMHYSFNCEISGSPINTILPLSLAISPSSTAPPILPLTPTYPTYHIMFRSRPRLRFGGCYISTVNYTRPGAIASNNLTWNAPVLIVTYYRYLRFFRDGSAISLLTTTEPADVVPFLQQEWLSYQHQSGSNLPQAVMKDALRARWRLTGDVFGEKAARAVVLGEEAVEEPELEMEGDVIVETEGVAPKYTYKMHLTFGSAGRGARNNKLNWKGYWNYNRLTDDWGEFGMKNYRPFFWSRVRSYGT